MKRRFRKLTVVMLAFAPGLSCGTAVQTPQADPPRPVSIIKLQPSNAAGSRRYTGSIESWHQESLAFEVPGRVIKIVEPGTEVQGPLRDTSGKIVQPGTILAELERTRFQNQLDAAVARHDSIIHKLEALRIEIEGVLPQQLDAAAAELDRAKSELARGDKAFRSGAATQSLIDQQTASKKTAEANVMQVKAGISAKEAERRAVEAQLAELQAAIEKSKIDLNDATLRAPFSGQVADVRVVNGGIVQAGQPALTLVMMDPLRVEVSVSAETDRSIQQGAAVQLQSSDDAGVLSELAGSGGSLVTTGGWVHEKSTVADPSTRTFKVRVMVRNQKLQIPMRPDLSPEMLRVSRWSALQPLDTREPTKLYVVNEALYGDEEKGYFTWQIAGVDKAAVRGKFDPLRKLKRVPLKLGQQRFDLPGGFVVYSLEDSGGLSAENLLAVGVPENSQDGQDVLMVQERWLFRPGELVTVNFEEESTHPGLYLPMAAIVVDAQKHFVFVVDEKSFARRVPVQLTGSEGSQRRIEGDSIAPGARVVVKGAHLLSNEGEPVRVIEEESTPATAFGLR